MAGGNFVSETGSRDDEPSVTPDKLNHVERAQLAMPQRISPPAPAGARRFVPWLWLLITPAIGAVPAPKLVHYLAAIGSPALRTRDIDDDTGRDTAAGIGAARAVAVEKPSVSSAPVRPFPSAVAADVILPSLHPGDFVPVAHPSAVSTGMPPSSAAYTRTPR